MQDLDPKNGRRASDWQGRASELRILDDLASVIESIALTYTGEAKSELSRLIGWMEGDPKIAASFAAELVKLKEAMSLFRSDKYPHATSVLVGVNRTLWDRTRGKG
jgi:hypothetical protein